MVGDKKVKYAADIDHNTNERNLEEIVSSDEKWNFNEITGLDEWIPLPTFVMRSDSVNEKWQVHEYFEWMKRGAEKTLSIKSPLDLTNLFREEPVASTIEAISQFISKTRYYSASQYTNPAECPAYFELEESDVLRRRLSGSASHKRFLFDLYLFKEKNPNGYREYLSLIGRDGLQLVDTIDFHTVPVPSSEIEVLSGGKILRKKIKRVLVVPHFVIHRTKLSPSQLSEGTFKTLAVLLYLSTDASELLLLLEEPEVCIHHGLLSSLIELIKSHAMQKQIIISTHSDFVLDQLQPENVFLVSNPKSKGTIVEPLPESMSKKGYGALKEYLNTCGNLGEYWRHSGFDNV